MADNQTETMAQFYEECQKKGYTDMKDATQSLKAKVIASDLGLNYNNIEKLYQTAHIAYDTVTKRKAAEKAEKERIAVNGNLIITFNSNWKVYRRADGSIYSDINDERCDGKPSIYYEQCVYYEYTYHGPTTTYNAVSINGMTSGWVDTQGDYFSSIKKLSNHGIIYVKSGDRRHELSSITLDQAVCDAYKRDDNFKKLVKHNSIPCERKGESESYSRYCLEEYKYTHDVVKTKNKLSYSKVLDHISLDECKAIVKLIQCVIDGQYPPSDEDLYNTAKDLSEKTTSSDLAKAIELFEKIADYKDSQALIEPTKARYEEVVQEEKEKAIMHKEKRTKIIKTIIVITLCCLIALFFIIWFFLPNIQYMIRTGQLKAGQYQQAMGKSHSFGKFY